MIGGIIMRKSERPFMVEFSGTPEAGKTTSILTVSKMLENAGYTTEILRESAESLPDEIPKGTFPKGHSMLTCGCILLRKQEF